MFTYFIYFIIVLLIYSTYQVPERSYFSAHDTFALFLILSLLFISWVRSRFIKVEKHLFREDSFSSEQLFTKVSDRLSVWAILLFAMNIYGLDLPYYFLNIPLLFSVPVLNAMIFLFLFSIYLSIVWYFGHRSYRIIYQSDVSRRSYILTNLAFAVPVIFPWLLLTGIIDLINFLPYEMPKQMLNTTLGELIYSLVFLGGIAVIGPVLIQKFWQCKPLDYGTDRVRIEQLCKRAGVKYANILKWPLFEGRIITAGVMGLAKKFRYILVTDALLRFLSPDEIDAVIAHEIGHVRRYHLWLYIFFIVGYIILTYTTFNLIIYLLIGSEFIYGLFNTAGFNPTTIISTGVTIGAILLFIVYFRYIFGYFMRNFERQADAHVYTLFSNASALISTLKKIAITSRLPPDKPNWHHFSITQRVNFLMQCENDSAKIVQHDQKVRKSLILYLFSLIVISVIGYSLSYGETGKQLNDRFIEKIILSELEKSPDSGHRYAILGDWYLHKKDYAATIRAYEEAITRNPDSAYVLNNLAWIYATCDDRLLRNPGKAIRLAMKAVKIKAAPHILDTLAESYYINGMIDDAIQTARRAVAESTDNHSYFKKQLTRFIANQDTQSREQNQ